MAECVKKNLHVDEDHERQDSHSSTQTNDKAPGQVAATRLRGGGGVVELNSRTVNIRGGVVKLKYTNTNYII